MLRRYLYRPWMRFIHRHGYHHAPKRPMPQPTETHIGLDGLPVIRNYHWCTWCGLRGTTVDYSERADTPTTKNQRNNP